MENKAKIYIIGAAAVLVSGVKLEDWKLVEKQAPEKLKVMDENGEPVFRIATDNGGGTVNPYGICWGSYVSDDGCATVTVLLDEEIDDKKAAVSGIMGSALLALQDIEEKMPEMTAEIRERMQKADAYIETV